MIRLQPRHSWTLLPILALMAVGASISALAADDTIILGQEDAATESKSALQTTGKLLKEAYDAGEITSLIYYGNWYGPGLSGGEYFSGKAGNSQPVDELDAIAQRHDFAYDIAAEMGKTYGPHEEARLKAIADSIAVREANALPRNPLEWDPPAPDPEKATNYRNRIGFGFVYTSKVAGAASKVMGAYQAIRDTIKNREIVLPASSEIDEAELQRLARERAKDWFNGASVRRLYRAELSPSSDLLEDIGSVDIQVRLHPVIHEGSPYPATTERAAESDPKYGTSPTLTLTASGYGELSETSVVPDATVTLTATKKLWGAMSTVGSTVTVTAKYTGTAAEVIEATTTLTVARATFLEISATPELIGSWEPDIDNPCVPVTIRAELKTRDGKAVADMPLNFARDNGSSEIVKTDSEGVATFTTELCKDEVEGEIQKLIPFIVTTTASEVNGTIYLSASRTVNVDLRGEETKVIKGRVIDKIHDDRPIEGASVSITDPKGEQRSTLTDSNGSFRFAVPMGNESYPSIQGTVSATGYDSGSFSATTDGKTYIVGLYPIEATLIGRIVNEDGGRGIDGSTVHITAPFDQLLNTSGGEFTVTGLYVGDTVTMRADAQNFRAYVKSGKITMQNPVVTFRLTEGKGEVSNVLEEEEATDADKQQVADLTTLYSLMVWATPANPTTLQSVTITAQIFPPKAGISIEIQMHGTDEYASSITGSTDAMGRVLLSIPGATSGVVDDIVAWIVGTNVKQRLRYSF